MSAPKEIYYFQTEYTVHVTHTVEAYNLDEAENIYYEYGNNVDSENYTDLEWAELVRREIESNLDDFKHARNCIVEQTKPTTIVCLDREECKSV